MKTADKKEAPVDGFGYQNGGIAGFAFGNAMMFVSPNTSTTLVSKMQIIWLKKNAPFLDFLTFFIGTSCCFYSASDYYKSALVWAKKNKIVNIDVPIVLGILVFLEETFTKSRQIMDLDILTPLWFVILMLIGKYFQKNLQRTFLR